MTKKMRNVFAILMVLFLVLGIVFGMLTHEEKYYIPFILLALILAIVVMFAKRKDFQKKKQITAGKIYIWACIFWVLFVIVFWVSNKNMIITIPFLIIADTLCIIGVCLHIKEVREAFKNIIFDMGCTEKEMSIYGKVVSDEELIPKMEKFIAMSRYDYNLKERDKDGKTVLIYAALYGRANVVKYLLDKRADINMKDYDFFSALHAGVMSNNAETVKILLKTGAEVNAKDSMGNSPIMMGDYTTDLEVFKLLMEYGANPEQKNYYGVSAMDRFAGSAEILEILSQR